MQSLFFFLQKKLKPLCTQNKKVSIWRLLLPNKISCWECVESSALCVKLMRVVSVTLHLVLWYTLQTEAPWWNYLLRQLPLEMERTAFSLCQWNVWITLPQNWKEKEIDPEGKEIPGRSAVSMETTVFQIWWNWMGRLAAQSLSKTLWNREPLRVSAAQWCVGDGEFSDAPKHLVPAQFHWIEDFL